MSRRAGTDDLAERAARWLLGQQLPHGTWRGQLPPTLTTVTVLSAIRRSGMAGEEMPADLAGGLALVRRGRLLGLERSIDARQLAVIAAYTGIESILYALLGHADFDAATVRDSGLSIGFDKALHAYESRLVELGRLEEGKHVAGYSTLRSLSHVRDGVVHRGTQPSSDDTQRVLTSSARFVCEQVAAVFGFDPSEGW
jgi:hypothetical protein